MPIAFKNTIVFTMKNIRLIDAYQFTGFIPKKDIYTHPTILDAVIIPMKRNKKKQIVQYVVKVIMLFMIIKQYWSEICLVDICRYILR